MGKKVIFLTATILVLMAGLVPLARAETEKKPTTVSTLGKTWAFWPDQLPRKVQDNWKRLALIYAETVSTDKDRPLSRSYSSFGTGFITANAVKTEFFIVTVSHIYVGNIASAGQEPAHQDNPALKTNVFLADKFDGHNLTGIKLELVAAQPMPYDFAVFKINLPTIQRETIENPGFPPLTTIEIDWGMIQRKLPSIYRLLKSAGSLDLSEPALGMEVHLAGFTLTEEYGIKNSYRRGYIDELYDNHAHRVQISAGGNEATHVVKQEFSVVGNALSGMSGSFVVSDEGKLIGLVKSTVGFTIIFASASKDLRFFLEQINLGFLIKH